MKKFQNEAYGYIKDMFAQHNMVKRTVLSFISVFITGFAVALFSLSGFGVDPFTSMNMNIASVTGMSFGTYQLIVNIAVILFVIIVAHRGLVGIGTVFNMIFVGYSCEFFEHIIKPVMENEHTVLIRIAFLFSGIVIMCFSSSLFFTANVGVGPYDALSFMISNATGIKCKWARVITDVAVILIGLTAGGGIQAIFSGSISSIKNIGIGTVITALCMGPLINFFNKHVSSKILNIDYEHMSKDIAFFLIKGAMVKNNLSPITGMAPQTRDNAIAAMEAKPFEPLQTAD